jgi:hypothetical protein
MTSAGRAQAHLWSAAGWQQGTASLGPPTMFAGLPARLLSDLLVWTVPGTAAGSPVRFLCWGAGTERRALAHGRVCVSWTRPEAA